MQVVDFQHLPHPKGSVENQSAPLRDLVYAHILGDIKLTSQR